MRGWAHTSTPTPIATALLGGLVKHNGFRAEVEMQQMSNGTTRGGRVRSPFPITQSLSVLSIVEVISNKSRYRQFYLTRTHDGVQHSVSIAPADARLFELVRRRPGRFVNPGASPGSIGAFAATLRGAFANLRVAHAIERSESQVRTVAIPPAPFPGLTVDPFALRWYFVGNSRTFSIRAHLVGASLLAGEVDIDRARASEIYGKELNGSAFARLGRELEQNFERLGMPLRLARRHRFITLASRPLENPNRLAEFADHVIDREAAELRFRGRSSPLTASGVEYLLVLGRKPNSSVPYSELVVDVRDAIPLSAGSMRQIVRLAVDQPLREVESPLWTQTIYGEGLGLFEAHDFDVGDISGVGTTLRVSHGDNEAELTIKEYLFLRAVASAASRHRTTAEVKRMVFGDEGHGVTNLKLLYEAINGKLSQIGSSLKIRARPHHGYELFGPDRTKRLTDVAQLRSPAASTHLLLTQRTLRLLGVPGRDILADPELLRVCGQIARRRNGFTPVDELPLPPEAVDGTFNRIRASMGERTSALFLDTRFDPHGRRFVTFVMTAAHAVSTPSVRVVNRRDLSMFWSIGDDQWGRLVQRVDRNLAQLRRVGSSEIATSFRELSEVLQAWRNTTSDAAINLAPFSRMNSRLHVFVTLSHAPLWLPMMRYSSRVLATRIAEFALDGALAFREARFDLASGTPAARQLRSESQNQIDESDNILRMMVGEVVSSEERQHHYEVGSWLLLSRGLLSGYTRAQLLPRHAGRFEALIAAGSAFCQFLADRHPSRFDPVSPDLVNLAHQTVEMGDLMRDSGPTEPLIGNDAGL